MTPGTRSSTTRTGQLEIRLGAGDWYWATQVELNDDPVTAAKDVANAQQILPDQHLTEPRRPYLRKRRVEHERKTQRAPRQDFAYPLPHELDATHVAPLLCAGIIGFRSLRVAGVKPGDRVGLFGFGSSATLSIPVLHSWGCEVYVVTRGEAHRAAAVRLGATWVGNEDARPPVALDCAITFAPSGKVVVDALSSIRKGGVVAINAIHLDQMPAFLSTMTSCCGEKDRYAAWRT